MQNIRQREEGSRIKNCTFPVRPQDIHTYSKSAATTFNFTCSLLVLYHIYMWLDFFSLPGMCFLYFKIDRVAEYVYNLYRIGGGGERRWRGGSGAVGYPSGSANSDDRRVGYIPGCSFNRSTCTCCCATGWNILLLVFHPLWLSQYSTACTR